MPKHAALAAATAPPWRDGAESTARTAEMLKKDKLQIRSSARSKVLLGRPEIWEFIANYKELRQMPNMPFLPCSQPPPHGRALWPRPGRHVAISGRSGKKNRENISEEANDWPGHSGQAWPAQCIYLLWPPARPVWPRPDRPVWPPLEWPVWPQPELASGQFRPARPDLAISPRAGHMSPS